MQTYTREQQQRAAFESDAAPYGFDLERANPPTVEPWSQYRSSDTGHRWAGWLAAMDSIADPLPTASAAQ